MPAPLLAAIPGGLSLAQGLGLATAGSILGTPIVSQLLSRILPEEREHNYARGGRARGRIRARESQPEGEAQVEAAPLEEETYQSRRTPTGPNSRRIQGRARANRGQTAAEPQVEVAPIEEEMAAPVAAGPTPYEQITGQPRARAVSPQPEVVAAPVAEAPVAAPVAAPVPTTAELAAEEAGMILNEARAEQAAAEQAALDNRYNQLLAMYGIAPGSGAPRVNQQAAQEYYQDPSVYEALSRVYAGAPAWR